MKPDRFTLYGLGIIIGLYLILGTAYSVVVPLGEAPDEVDHFLYVRYLLEQRAFPVMQPAAVDNVTMEANQPPLFYLLNAAITAFFPLTASADLPANACYSFTPGHGRAHFYLHDWTEQHVFADTFLAFRAARLLSVALGAATVWLAFVLARQAAPARPSVWLLAAGLLAFNPQFLFITASVNNDVLMALLGAGIVALSVRAATRPSAKAFACLGMLVGLGLLTKFALLALWPLAILAVLAAAVRPHPATDKPSHPHRQTVIWHLLLVSLLPVLMAGWWYGRAYRLYGDPLAWRVHLQAKGEQVLRTAPLTLADLWDFALIHFQSYWGWFGWLKLPLPGWVYGFIGMLVLLAVIGVVCEINDWRVEIKRPWSLCANSQPQHVALLFNLLAVAAIYLSLLRYIQTINWSGYQGRLAFAAAGPAAALLAVGMACGFRQMAAKSTVIRTVPRLPVYHFVVLGFLCLSVVTLLFVLRPAFARPALFRPAIDLPRRCLEVAGLQIEAAQVADGRAGDAVALTLHSYAQETAIAQPLHVQITGRDGQVIGQSQGVYDWAAGDLLTTQLVVPILAEAAPVRGVIHIGSPGDVHALGTVKISPARPYQAEPEVPLANVTFGGQLTLLGYDWDGAMITLYWQAARVMAADYTTFVHVLDGAGRLVAQADGPPQSGWYPTSVWGTGEQVADPKPLMLPTDRPLRVVAGAYLLETGQRLTVAETGADVYELFTLSNE